MPDEIINDIPIEDPFLEFNRRLQIHQQEELQNLINVERDRRMLFGELNYRTTHGYAIRRNIIAEQPVPTAQALINVEDMIEERNIQEIANGRRGTFRVNVDPLFVEDDHVIEELSKKMEKNSNKVTLSETKEEINKDEGVFITPLGWFRKDDKRIKSDYARPDYYCIIDPKYKDYTHKVYTDITKDGELVHNDTYTNRYRPSKMIIKETYLPFVSENGKDFSYISLDLLNNTIFNYKFKENFSEQCFFHKNLKIKDKGKGPKVVYRKHKSEIGSFSQSIEQLPNTFIKTQGKKFSFGIEIETTSGVLPEYVDNWLYYSAVHDGSLRDTDDNTAYGGEYVTDVLRGDLGLRQLKHLCYELTKRTIVDNKCSVHFHIGDVIFNKETVVLMYFLYQKIQEEIYKYIPSSRRRNEYCRPLDKISISIAKILQNRTYFIEKCYQEIINSVSKQDYNTRKVNKSKDHPKGFKCGYDHSSSRYCWVNFIPALFDTRKNGVYTIEFRHVQGSTSYRKIRNWLLICFCLVDIVENHKQSIYDNPNISLEEIINICCPKISTKLISFIEECKSKFDTDDVKIELNDYKDNELDNNFKILNL